MTRWLELFAILGRAGALYYAIRSVRGIRRCVAWTPTSSAPLLQNMDHWCRKLNGSLVCLAGITAIDLFQWWRR